MASLAKMKSTIRCESVRVSCAAESAKTREALGASFGALRQQTDLHDKRRHRDEAQFRSSLSARAKHKQRRFVWALAVNLRLL